MSKKITPDAVASQFKWDIGAITHFCARALEAANDHNISLALRALNAGRYDLAKSFIDLEEKHFEAGSLTPELAEKRRELAERLERNEGETDESEEDPRDRSARR